jgi:hypothetical protein
MFLKRVEFIERLAYVEKIFSTCIEKLPFVVKTFSTCIERFPLL